jgi:predicted RNA-binding Zn-ribbon protein involved in translation (DUF1610 family)
MAFNEAVDQLVYEEEHCQEVVCTECGAFSLVDEVQHDEGCPECGGEVEVV